MKTNNMEQVLRDNGVHDTVIEKVCKSLSDPTISISFDSKCDKERSFKFTWNPTAPLSLHRHFHALFVLRSMRVSSVSKVNDNKIMIYAKEQFGAPPIVIVHRDDDRWPALIDGFQGKLTDYIIWERQRQLAQYVESITIPTFKYLRQLETKIYEG